MIVLPVVVVGLLVLIITGIIVAAAVVVNRRSFVQVLSLTSKTSEVYENKRSSEHYDVLTMFSPKKGPGASLTDNLNSTPVPV